ncbi:MAG: tetratricopeptide repeat protein [Candidatus Dadabacteria bacterium]|nr:tetratricopeptide repeat protein [Candidatus Dadabacteria bacterium]
MSESDTKPEPVKSIREYADRVRELTEDRRCIFRGLPDAEWALESAAWRRIKKSAEDNEMVPNQQHFVEYHRDLIDRIRSKGHGYEGARSLHDLELLAKLQHHGAATAFIDFTKNIYVALWFAVDSQQEKNGTVCIINNTDITKFIAVNEDKFSSGNREIEDFLQPQSSDSATKEKQPQPSYWHWEAQRVRAERILRQSSIFVFGKSAIDEGDYQKIVVDKGAKREIWEELNRLHDINAETLFPDFSGLSIANRVKRYYHIKTAREYFADGNAHYQIGKYEKAIESYTRAIKINPQYATAYINRGNCYFQIKDREKAISDYTGAIEIDPQHAMAYNNLGTCYFQIGENEKAISDYTRAIEIDPQCAMAYGNRGDCYSKIGENEKAISDYTNAIEIGPQDTVAYYNRGYCYSQIEEYQKAISDYTRAIEINPQYAMAYGNRGYCYSEIGEYQKAIADYTKDIEINPQTANAYNNRAIDKYAINSGDKSAEEDIRKALNLAREQGDQDFVQKISNTMREWGMPVPE